MNNRRKKQNELYWKQKELRDMSMIGGNYDQVEKMRKRQDNLYKMFKFYEGINKALERNKKDESKFETGK